jgi:hypothetical protein
MSSLVGSFSWLVPTAPVLLGFSASASPWPLLLARLLPEVHPFDI